MPIYEYRCASCGHELESMQKLSEAPLLNCPSCHCDALVKLMSASGFQLKGSGWYATDFKSGVEARGQDPAPTRKRRTPSPRMRRPTQRRAAPPASPVATPGQVRRRLTWRRIDEALPDRRAARVGAARHHDLGAERARGDARPDAAARARPRWRPDALLGFHIPGLGALLSFAILLADRRLRRELLRRSGSFRSGKARSAGSRSSNRSTLSVKQVSDTVLSDQGTAFRKALLVEFPRTGCWTIAISHRNAGRRGQRSPDRRICERLRADHAQSDGRVLRDGADERPCASSRCLSTRR